MTKPTPKVNTKKVITTNPETTTVNNNPVLGPSTNNPPINPEDFDVEVIYNRSEPLDNDESKGDDIEIINATPNNNDAEVKEPEFSNLIESYSITSEGRTITQLGRGGVKFATGFQNLTALLESGFKTYNEALEYLNNNINSERFQYEEGFSIKKVYNRR
jgi:hypothetical protein